MSKSVTCRIYDNPKKYRALITLLDDFDKKKISDSTNMRSTFEKLFSRQPSLSELDQLRQFIVRNEEEIKIHVKQLKMNPGALILLQRQEDEILNKIKLHNVIKNIKIYKPSYKKERIEKIMLKAWGTCPPKNGFALVKKALTQKYDAKKIGKIPGVPRKCLGYRILEGKLVREKVSSPINFFDRPLEERIASMLTWIEVNKTVSSIIAGHCVIEIQDLKNMKSLSNLFYDERLIIQELRPYFTNEAFQNFSKKVEVKRKMSNYKCSICNTDDNGKWVQCDSCLIWNHISCLSTRQALRSISLEKNEFFCFKCC